MKTSDLRKLTEMCKAYKIKHKKLKNGTIQILGVSFTHVEAALDFIIEIKKAIGVTDYITKLLKEPEKKIGF